MGFKGCVCCILAILFSMFKREHFGNKKKISFNFKSSFRSWDCQISTFQIFKCHDVIKQNTFYWITSTVNTNLWWNLANVCNITKENFLSKIIWKCGLETSSRLLLIFKECSVKGSVRCVCWYGQFWVLLIQI